MLGYHLTQGFGARRMTFASACILLSLLPHRSFSVLFCSVWQTTICRFIQTGKLWPVLLIINRFETKKTTPCFQFRLSCNLPVPLCHAKLKTVTCLGEWRWGVGGVRIRKSTLAEAARWSHTHK